VTDCALELSKKYESTDVDTRPSRKELLLLVPSAITGRRQWEILMLDFVRWLGTSEERFIHDLDFDLLSMLHVIGTFGIFFTIF